MTYRPGDVTEKGEIFTRDGTFLARGAVYVTLEQALKSLRYGWHIRSGVCDPKHGTTMVIYRE